MNLISPAALPLPIALFDMIGSSELLVIMLLVLIFFGGEKMPQFARGLGKALREFRKAASGVEQEIKRAMEEEPTPAKTPVAHPSAIPTTPTILPPQSAASAVGLAPAANPPIPPPPPPLEPSPSADSPTPVPAAPTPESPPSDPPPHVG